MNSKLTGMKLRIPDNANPQWIVDAVDRLDSLDFNLLIPETFYHGYTIYPSSAASSAGFPARRPAFQGWDPLDAILREAHSREMAVYTWVETLYVGNDLIEGLGPILARKSEWAARRADGTVKCGPTEPGHHFLCPANPEPREYIGDLYQELAERYPVDGLFVDYLRYPIGSLLDNPFCYCDYCRDAVRSELGLELENIPLDLNSPDFVDWAKWRQDRTTEAMRYLYGRIKQAEPQPLVIANVYGGYSDDLLAHDTLRDWVEWGREGIVDVISTQNYSDDDEAVISQIKSDLEVLPTAVPLLPAITVDDLTRGNRQAEFIRTTRAIGVAYFVFADLFFNHG